MSLPATSALDLDVVRLPMPSLVADYAAERITTATRILWPTAIMKPGPVVPSVTSHVQQIHVDGRLLYAKVELLGMSLVSVIRGRGGDWPTVKAAQVAYLARPGTLLEREAIQLQALANAGLSVPAVAGHRPGVLFTEHARGVTLAELVAQNPACTADLLRLVRQELDPALGEPALTAEVDRAPITERSITGTFMRKFNGLSGPTYLNRTPHGEALRAVVFRLRTAYAGTTVLARPVIFGDLKPEHVLFPPDGGRPVFIDPGLMRGPLCADLAKLLSRLLLDLVARPPGEDDVRRVLEGIAAYTADVTTPLKAADASLWLRQLMVLWLMDTTNILSTYLTNPPDLPMSPQGAAVAARAEDVCRMLDLCTTALTPRRSSRDTWSLCLAHAAQAMTR
ncbi:hypothetical protein OG413_20385 [Streptomyces sp. NBC_01433]|uniref:hypothetical protein n=1 Tax=Streptomyces sp. NBC_01433 TaxID=2903864 RepID=UPI002257F507|nr:hypothetical protein [Streptomyces sp. NBC_01433]MCX4677632.1 hypothetical protein [Streptomyces sp. NBC_01433]